MSDASKCDRCGTFHEPAHGNVALDVHLTLKDKKTCSSWSDVDLCPKCSTAFLKFIAPALNDLEKDLPPRE